MLAKHALSQLSYGPEGTVVARLDLAEDGKRDCAPRKFARQPAGA